MNILGLSAFYHDSAACLVQDGRIVEIVDYYDQLSFQRQLR